MEINIEEFAKGIVNWYKSEKREFVKLKILEDLEPILKLAKRAKN